MKNDLSENVILFDWLTCSFQDPDPESWKLLLDMKSCDWIDLEHGRNGYRKGIYFGGISILYDGTETMGVCVEMSGQGCRSFETYGSGDWISLFACIIENDIFHISRLDVAFDDHTGILNVDQLFRDTEDKLFISRFRTQRLEKQYVNDRCGITIYHGSRQSDILFRIYDKAAERGREDQHWIRVEMQLRNERALEFIRQSAPVGQVFAGVLHNYLRYVDPGSDQNKWRWKMKPYWSELISGAEKISLFSSPGTEYNVGRLDHFVFDMAGPALRCALELYGATYIVQRILNCDISDNLKYKKLISQYKERRSSARSLIEQNKKSV